MNEKFTVATFSDEEKALAAQQRLQQAGIPAEVKNERKLQRFWFMSKPLASQKVQVTKALKDDARLVLERSQPVTHVLDGEVRCPDCGSVHVEYPQFTRKFITTTLIELGCVLGFMKKRFYCLECHQTWGTEKTVPQKKDALNWPVKAKAKV